MRLPLSPAPQESFQEDSKNAKFFTPSNKFSFFLLWSHYDNTLGAFRGSRRLTLWVRATCLGCLHSVFLLAPAKFSRVFAARFLRRSQGIFGDTRRTFPEVLAVLQGYLSGDGREGFRSACNKLPGWVTRGNHIRFQVHLVSRVVCGTLPSSSSFGSLIRSLGAGSWAQGSRRGFKVDPDITARENVCKRGVGGRGLRRERGRISLAGVLKSLPIEGENGGNWHEQYSEHAGNKFPIIPSRNQPGSGRRPFHS